MHNCTRECVYLHIFTTPTALTTSNLDSEWTALLSCLHMTVKIQEMLQKTSTKNHAERTLTIPAPLQRRHVSGLVPGGTPDPPKLRHNNISKKYHIFICMTTVASDMQAMMMRTDKTSVPQASQGNSVWNITVLVHPCTASINDSSSAT